MSYHKLIKCRSCSYQFDPLKESKSKQRKCGMCCFGDSYSVFNIQQMMIMVFFLSYGLYLFKFKAITLLLTL